MSLRVLLKQHRGLSRFWMLSMRKQIAKQLQPNTVDTWPIPMKRSFWSPSEFKDIFDGTLGDWDTEPVSLKLKEGAKTYHGRPYLTPKVHQPTLKKEVNRLCQLGVLKWQPESELALPSFIVPKQDHTVQVVSDLREVNKRIVRNLFPIPKISTVLQELKWFTYETALGLNMVIIPLDWILIHPKYAQLFFRGEVLVPQTTHGNCMFSRHLPS